jgi:sugar O-acyltransferase (sialic acid O-acetyltransferase NeuD family)
MDKNSVILFSYSGHAFVVADILLKSGNTILGYLEKEAKDFNPFRIKHLGFETDDSVLKLLKTNPAFIANGSNKLRKIVFEKMKNATEFINAIHPSANIGMHVEIGNGTMIGANCIINPLARIGNAVICNTGSIIEHECIIEDYVHLAPGSVLCGNVTVGEGSFIGANAVIKQGITIGKNCIIGAGSVILKNVEDGKVVVGNGRILK